MRLSELIAAYGDDKVEFQNLDQCADSLNMNKGVTRIMFGTPQPITPNGTTKLGLVVWLDRERVADLIKEAIRMQPPAGETIRSTQDGSMEGASVTGQSPVDASSTSPPTA